MQILACLLCFCIAQVLRTAVYTTAMPEAASQTPDHTQVADPQTFHIDNEEKLTWYINTLLSIGEQQARIQAQAQAMVADLEREAESLRQRFGAEAEHYTKQVLEGRGGRAKHLKLLTGTVGFRRSPDRIVVRHEQQLLEWAEHHAPSLIARKLDTKRLAVRDGRVLVKETGEVVESSGIEVVAGEDKFYVKSAKTNESNSEINDE
jgi:phage host-nuclease inhibitor protein Gam